MIYKKLSTVFYFNLIIRFFLEGYLEFSITSLLNIKNMGWKGISESFSSFFALLIASILIFLPFFLTIFLLKYQHQLEEPRLKSRIGSIYHNLRVGSKNALLFNVLFLIRRLVYALTYVFLFDSPLFQIQVLTLSTTGILIYIVLVKPFGHKFYNSLEVFNELTILAVSLHLYAFTQYLESADIQYQMGWSVIVITCFNLAINMLVVILGGINKFLLAYKQMRYNCKKKKLNERSKKYPAGDAILEFKRQIVLRMDNRKQKQYTVDQMSSIRKSMTQFKISNDLLMIRQIKNQQKKKTQQTLIIQNLLKSSFESTDSFRQEVLPKKIANTLAEKKNNNLNNKNKTPSSKTMLLEEDVTPPNIIVDNLDNSVKNANNKMQLMRDIANDNYNFSSSSQQDISQIKKSNEGIPPRKTLKKKKKKKNKNKKAATQQVSSKTSQEVLNNLIKISNLAPSQIFPHKTKTNNGYLGSQANLSSRRYNNNQDDQSQFLQLKRNSQPLSKSSQNGILSPENREKNFRGYQTELQKHQSDEKSDFQIENELDDLEELKLDDKNTYNQFEIPKKYMEIKPLFQQNLLGFGQVSNNPIGYQQYKAPPSRLEKNEYYDELSVAKSNSKQRKLSHL